MQDDHDGTNTVATVVDKAAEVVDVAAAVDVSRVTRSIAGRTKPPPAGAHTVGGVTAALMRCSRNRILCWRAHP